MVPEVLDLDLRCAAHSLCAVLRSTAAAVGGQTDLFLFFFLLVLVVSPSMHPLTARSLADHHWYLSSSTPRSSPFLFLRFIHLRHCGRHSLDSLRFSSYSLSFQIGHSRAIVCHQPFFYITLPHLDHRPISSHIPLLELVQYHHYQLSYY
jgi:hypothetical protein